MSSFEQYFDITNKVLDNILMCEIDKLEEPSKDNGIMQRYGCTFEALKKQYIEYLIAACVASTIASELSPPLQVDELWHLHLLETESYDLLSTLIIDEVKNVCKNVKITKIHHSSVNRREGRKRRLEATAYLYGKLGFDFDNEQENGALGQESKKRKLVNLCTSTSSDTHTESDSEKELNGTKTNSDVDVNTITFAIRDQKGELTLFHNRRNLDLESLVKEYANRTSYNWKDVRLSLKGIPVLGGTLTDYSIKDEDILDCVLEVQPTDTEGVSEKELNSAKNNNDVDESKRRKRTEKDTGAPQLRDEVDLFDMNVRDQTGEVTVFRIRRNTSMEKIFRVYAQRKGVDGKSLRFLLNAERICGSEKVSDYEIGPGCTLDCIMESIGC